MMQAAMDERVAQSFFVVGIGASAGGIAAMQGLFAGIPAQPNLAFVVVQHQSTPEASALAALVSRWTPLSVRPVTDGAKLERDIVFVAPAGRVVSLDDGVFITRPFDREVCGAGIDTIDSMFESLARDVGPRAIAVVLSGTGHDGAAGALRVKQAGGTVFVQDPTTADYGDMPAAVIASGAVDHVLSVAAMAEQFAACSSPSYVRSSSPATWTDGTYKALDGIIELLRTSAGLDLSAYKTAPLLWRLQRRMELRRVPQLPDYEALLHDDPVELQALVRSIPIHVTAFFRDPKVWAVLEHDVIADLFRDAGDAPVRAWSAACATGEEAYSLAMLLSERAGQRAFQLFGTDASTEIVARASRGVFSQAAIGPLSLDRRQRFLYAADGAFRIKRELREKMVFAPHDLLADPPFSGLDLVVCRYLMIYLEPEAVERVVWLLHSALRMGGYLFVANAESLATRQHGFEPVAAGSAIYRKVAEHRPGVEFPRRPNHLRPSRSSHLAIDAHAHHDAVCTHELPALLVDERFGVLRVYGDTSAFLRMRAGEPSLDLLQLVQPAIGVLLPNAALVARTQERIVTLDRLTDPITGDPSLSVRVTPLPRSESTTSQFLVSFLRSGRDLPDVSERDRGRSASAATADWSEALRLSREELESSREELHVVNEELRASNHQLNVVNEELNNVNRQLRDKIDELETQSNVLSSGAVMTLFLDPEMRIRLFTPEMRQLFPLRASDVGRRITDLVPSYSDALFVDRVAAVMTGGEAFEGEVRCNDGRWYQQHIRPFRADHGARASAGVAITFADITDLKRVERTAREGEAWLAGQNEAFRAAMNGAALEVSLGILVRTALDQLGDGARCAFYLVDPTGSTLHHVVGLPDGYRECVDGFRVGADSLACGLAVYTERAVITPDVLEEPLWKERLDRAQRFHYRACWSFPVETSAGKVVGTCAIYYERPRVPTARDLELAAALTRAAAIIVSRDR